MTVTRPDGTTETLGPYTTDTTGGTGTLYVPNQIGTYTLQTHYAGEVLIVEVRRVGPAGMEMKPSSSEKIELIVQQEPLTFYPGFPLPTEYWTRPIDAQIREWNSISGSWLTAPRNLFAPYNDGPETAHILWTKPITMGGWVGGDIAQSFEIGDAYEGKWSGSVSADRWASSSIILAGRLYYQHTTRDKPIVYHCVDLHTGEELWSKTFLDNRTIAFGQLFHWSSFNYHGTYKYLWVTTGEGRGETGPVIWYAFDAFTGDWMYSIEDVPSGTTLFGSNGEIYRYTINLKEGWMTLWNSTRTGNPQNTSSSADGSWGRYTHGNTFSATRGIEWNKTIPTGLPGSVNTVFLNDRIIGSSIGGTESTVWAISTAPGKEGTLLFNTTWQSPADWIAGSQTIQWMQFSLEDEVGTLYSKETGQNYGVSLATGELLWGPTTPAQQYLDALDDTKEGARCIAYGKLYSASVSGIVYCYDVKTGETLWTYEVSDPYSEILWANTWWARPLFITDGKIYVGSYEHSPIDPRPRGAPFTCLDAETGEVIWRVDGLFRQTRWGGRAIIGDSIIATMDTYDQRI
ncbi:MAG: PQQ-binding-like beta-propeller repeat protein, partial [Thermoplasmata archaeon]|nr:PQQ-binding-like beta-propeller repeat protein [Thermoplasmata archaeon]